MTKEAQNVAISERLGWMSIQKSGRMDGQLVGYPPNGLLKQQEIPNFTSDLNACAEMEKTLGRHFLDYNATLFKVVTDTNLARGIQIPRHIFSVITATPAQRAEAFLRTLGLWQDDPAKSS